MLCGEETRAALGGSQRLIKKQMLWGGACFVLLQSKDCAGLAEGEFLFLKSGEMGHECQAGSGRLAQGRRINRTL